MRTRCSRCTEPSEKRKPIHIDTATTQAEPTENGTLQKITVGSIFYINFENEKFFGHDFKTAEPLLHGQRVDGGVESAIEIIA